MVLVLVLILIVNIIPTCLPLPHPTNSTPRYTIAQAKSPKDYSFIHSFILGIT
ncbi:hypothetical protein BofuT4_uP133330.1 [Botrytis cinerea T4]|uniref:Uncharacterized protein n=1 Tax=Botryotinia fuckeliana (strain T4) TaxID=999810 RepID=G2YQ81_BOTF4|nr:hypothetical protein BofuT4_uP133330.1 [Botrytis cinerea T4]